MKLSALAFAFAAASVSTPALAGQASIPFQPIHDLDLDGKPLETPMCSDGWVESNNNPGICHPFQHPDIPVIDNNKNEPTPASPSNASPNSSSSATATSSSTSAAALNNNITIKHNNSFRLTPVVGPHNSITITAGTDFDSVALQANYTYQFGRPKVKPEVIEVLPVPQLPTPSQVQENVIDYITIQERNRELEARLELMQQKLDKLVSTPATIPAKH